MSTTQYWNMVKPVEGQLNWNIPIVANYDLIDSALQSIRNNFSEITDPNGPTDHSDVGSLWYSKIQSTFGKGLFVKSETGYIKLLDKATADSSYAKLTGSILSGTFTASSAILYWGDVPNNSFAKLYYQTYGTNKNLTFEFGSNSGKDAIRFVWNPSGNATDVLDIYNDKIVALQPVQVPNASDNTHALNKGTATSLYSTIRHQHIGTLTQNKILQLYIADNQFNISSGRAVALTAGNTYTTINVMKSSDNGVTFSQVGTFGFDQGQSVSALTITGSSLIHINDIIKVQASSTVSQSIADLTWNIKVQ